MGKEVLLIANGKAVEILTKAGADFEASDSAKKLLAKWPSSALPEAILTSACSDGGVGCELVALLRGQCPRVLVTDYWTGAQLQPFYLANRPDFVVVNDQVGADLVAASWQGYPADHIKILGWPALDKYAGYDVGEARKRVRYALGMTRERWPMVLLAGQFPLADLPLTALIFLLNHDVGDGEVYLLARPHPRTINNCPEDAPAWQRAANQMRKGQLVFDFFGQFASDIPALVAAADVVVSPYSTTLIEAAVLRKNNISYLPASLWEQFAASAPGIKEFPLVSMGCSAKATSRLELGTLLADAFAGRMNLREAQEGNFRPDGKSAERVANFALSLL